MYNPTVSEAIPGSVQLARPQQTLLSGNHTELLLFTSPSQPCRHASSTKSVARRIEKRGVDVVGAEGWYIGSVSRQPLS